jgi:hypothetical protein
MQEGHNNMLNANPLPPKAGLPYEAPYGYFESLPHKVQARMQQVPRARLGAVKQWAGWALAAVVLAMGWMVWGLLPAQNAVDKSLSALPEETISEYLLTHSEPHTLLLLADAENIDWPLVKTPAGLSEKELLDWVENEEIINVMMDI